ncbi:hypothetical protein [Candidatus Borrarchaeum sp.]|uniref:hypothetical protein n=1 Tax=Candidatus Borrarchaeum sp. TaxID=2846742 RepID=UPI00257C0F0A|nr:hypothetical protein [Candidatus Borrarchaeum sp.]
MEKTKEIVNLLGRQNRLLEKQTRLLELLLQIQVELHRKSIAGIGAKLHEIMKERT